MSKSDLLKDSMKGGLDGLLSSTKKSTGGKQPVAAPTEKETAVHCNFVINKSIHTVSYTHLTLPTTSRV